MLSCKCIAAQFQALITLYDGPFFPIAKLTLLVLNFLKPVVHRSCMSEFINILISEDLEKSKKRIFFNEVNIKSLLTLADEVELKIKE